LTTVHHVKKARVDRPEHGIHRGDEYWWWDFPREGRHYSRTYPRRSQLTQSKFNAQIWDIEDEIADLKTRDVAELYEKQSEWAAALRKLGDSLTVKAQHEPVNLQDSPTAVLLRERAEACENMATDIEDVYIPIDNDQMRDEAIAEVASQLNNNEEETPEGQAWIRNAVRYITEQRIDEIITLLKGIQYDS
jgi:hypothetical protein